MSHSKDFLKKFKKCARYQTFPLLRRSSNLLTALVKLNTNMASTVISHT